jgi:protein-disulfide isomerase
VPVLEQVLEKNPESVKLVFKDFPLSSHKFSRQAAIAAVAAGRQGKFWEFHDLLFKDYNRLNEQKFIEIAQKLDLDMKRFDQDRKAPGIVALINRDLAEGNRMGVRGTPTVFINGRLLRNRNLAGFQDMIEEMLRQEKTP